MEAADRVIGDPARIGPLIETTARGRVALPAEVAAVGASRAVFLASQAADLAARISGTVLDVDGGRSANY